MAAQSIRDSDYGVAPALAHLDEYQRETLISERSIAKLLSSSRETLAQSRLLLARIEMA